MKLFNRKSKKIHIYLRFKIFYNNKNDPGNLKISQEQMNALIAAEDIPTSLYYFIVDCKKQINDQYRNRLDIDDGFKTILVDYKIEKP